MVEGKQKLLSILIPVYNWDLSLLLESVLGEIDDHRLGEAVEVLILDDRSIDTTLRGRNESLISSSGREYLRYGALEQNVGRAAIRNILAARAAGKFLLFLDCDVVPDSPDFIRTYLVQAERNDYDVVCGGVSYRRRVLTGREYDYHAYLGNRKEVKAAEQRNAFPWSHILTSNIMVRKSVFTGTSFDERFTGYGYEDIEWGFRLAEDFRILHIDNTASHLGLVTKDKTYQKMRNSVGNYLLLKDICPKAFHASTISKIVACLTSLNDTLLRLLDRVLKPAFLRCSSNWLSFLFFQFNFAVLLAATIRKNSRNAK